jgi:hypothetical protein
LGTDKLLRVSYDFVWRDLAVIFEEFPRGKLKIANAFDIVR